MPFNPSHDTLRRAQGGDAQALDELITLIQPLLYRFSVKMCGTPEDAEEVLQDTLITVVRSVQDFRGASSFSTWAYTIARNFCLKRRRKSKFAPNEEESLDWQHSERLMSTEPNPEEDVADLELWKQLRAGIQRIEPDYREILVLRDIEGLSAKEVAEVVELSVPAVKSRLHRARGQLRGHLESTPFEPLPGCPDIRQVFSEHLEGDLSPDICSTMEAHVSTCSICSSECDGLKAALNACSTAPCEVPTTVQTRIKAVLRHSLAHP